MNNKNQAIEEMAKIVCGACDFICDCEYLMQDEKAYTWCDLPKEVCKALYNAGYCKVETVVEKVTVERPSMSDLLNDEMKELLKPILEQERKETIKKCADYLDVEKGYCGLGFMMKRHFGVEVE